MIKTANGKQFNKFLKKLDKIPAFADTVARSGLKKMANSIVREFKTGIENNSLNLDALKQRTIETKRKQGFKKPSTPLYGKGGRNKRSYKNMMNIRKTKSGYTIYPSTRKHWDGDITLRRLFLIHEYGATIKRGDKLIRIPPRPAFKKATAIARKKSIDDIRKEMRSKLVGGLS